tara:strand:+ start:262 stop:495 length:234 start_codon:yes stop_codon:yes gene_type:complete
MEKKYQEAFIEALSIPSSTDFKNLKYNEVDEWDSIGHMSLISELEEKFSISFETDDIVNFSSYEEGKKILKKIGVEI